MFQTIADYTDMHKHDEGYGIKIDIQVWMARFVYVARW